MYALKNKVQLIGHLGATPEIKELNGGKKMAKFNLATSESYRNQKGEKITDTQWHSLVAWGKLADLAETYLNKGSEVAVEGKLAHRAWVDQQGVKRYFTEIQVNEILLLSKKAN